MPAFKFADLSGQSIGGLIASGMQPPTGFGAPLRFRDKCFGGWSFASTASMVHYTIHAGCGKEWIRFSLSPIKEQFLTAFRGLVF
jgi:hypothetical protein